MTQETSTTSLGLYTGIPSLDVHGGTCYAPKVCEDVLQTVPKDILVFTLFGNGSDQVELGGNVYNMELLVLQKNQTINF